MFDQFAQMMRSPEVGGVIVVLTILLVADFITGVSRAFRVGVFQWGQVADFLGSHVIGRWLGLVVMAMLTPYAIVLVPVTALAVAAYSAETLASIRKNLDVAVNPDPA